MVKYLGFLLLSALAKVAFGQDLLTLTPNNLDINDKDFTKGSPVQVVLKAAPQGDVVVQFNTPSLLRVDKCQLSFTTANWQTPQTINVYPISNVNANGVKQIDLPMKVYSVGGATTGNSTCSVVDQKISITRTVVAAKICTSWGDPHVATLDGKTYDAYMPYAGAMTLFQSTEKDTTIQVHHYECTPGIQCMDKIAIRHYDAFLMLTGPTTATTASDPITVEFIKGSKDRIKYDRRMAKFFQDATQNVITFDVTLDDGTYLLIQFQLWDAHNDWYANIQMTVPGIYQNRVTGMCGTFNDNADDDIIDPATLRVIASSNTDLFSCKDKCDGFSSSGKDDMNECAIPDGFKPTACDVAATTTATTPTSTTGISTATTGSTVTTPPSMTTSSAAMAPTNTPAQANVEVKVKVAVVVGNFIDFDKHDGKEDKIAYCMRIGAKYQGNGTAELVNSLCNTDVKLSADVTTAVAVMVSMLQTKAQCQVRLAYASANAEASSGNGFATASANAEVRALMNKYNLHSEEKELTRYVNPTSGASYASAEASASASANGSGGSAHASASASASAKSVGARGGRGKKCLKRRMCLCD